MPAVIRVTKWWGDWGKLRAAFEPCTNSRKVPALLTVGLCANDCRVDGRGIRLWPLSMLLEGKDLIKVSNELWMLAFELGPAFLGLVRLDVLNKNWPTHKQNFGFLTAVNSSTSHSKHGRTIQLEEPEGAIESLFTLHFVNSNFNEKPKGNDVDVDVHRPGRACGMRMAKRKRQKENEKVAPDLGQVQP